MEASPSNMSQVCRPHVRTEWAKRLHHFMVAGERWSILLLVVSAGGAIVLALFGLEGAAVAESFDTRLYKSVQLLLFNLEVATGEGILLALARGLALVAAIVGAFEVVRRLFDRVLQRFFILMFYDDHFIVSGLDSTGVNVCEFLVESGCAVIAVEPNADSPLVARARQLGVLVHVGEGVNAIDLEAAGVDRAAWLIAPTGDSQLISAAHQTAVSGRSRPLQVLISPPVQTAEPRPMLISQRRYSGPLVSVSQVDLNDRVASFLVSDVGVFQHVLDVPTLQGLQTASIDVRRVLVVGDSAFCERLCGVLAWESEVVYSSVAGRHTIGLTLVHPRAKRIVNGILSELSSRVPPGGPGLSITTEEIGESLDAYALGVNSFITRLDSGACASKFDTIFASCSTDDHTLALADWIARRHSMQVLPDDPTIVAVLQEKRGGEVLRDMSADCWNHGGAPMPAKTSPGERKLLYVYESARRTFTSQRLLGEIQFEREPWHRDELDRMAARVNWAYEKRQEPAGTSADFREVLHAWDSLGDEYKESNRQFVRDIDRKLAMVGCHRVPVVNKSVGTSAVWTEVEIECLARSEHERWAVERWERGWSVAMTRDAADKLSPNLKPWHKLSEPIREIDRQMIRRIPTEILAPEGYRVERRLASDYSVPHTGSAASG